MPRYVYKCKSCGGEMDVRHEITERFEDCLLCEMKDSLYRIPQLTNVVKKQEQSERETGSLVKEYIEENKKILRQEKKERIEYDE